MMLTNVQRRKLTRMFRYLDGDGDGVLVRGDYDRICAALLRVLEARAGSPEADEIRASYALEWDELQAEADRAARPVTLKGWLAYRDAQLSGPDAFEVMIDPYVGTVFALLDRDADGHITRAEVRRYLGLYGMGEGALEEIFTKIDAHAEGVFSRAKIGQLAREFYFSDDEGAPGSWLLGRF